MFEDIWCGSLKEQSDNRHMQCVTSAGKVGDVVQPSSGGVERDRDFSSTDAR